MNQEQAIRKIKVVINRVIQQKKQIIFFGSRVEQTNRSNSDYDILVIVEEKGKSNKNQLLKYQSVMKRECAKLDIDADIIVRTRSHVNKMEHFQGNIIHSALQSGVSI